MSNTNPEFDFEEGDGSVDFDLTSDLGKFEVIPKGIYSAEIIDAEYKLSSAGNPMISTVWEIDSGPYKNRKLYYHFVFVAKTLFRVKRDFQRFAPELVTAKVNPVKIVDSEALLGKKANLKVDISRYQGERRNSVKELLPYRAKSTANFLDDKEETFEDVF